MNDEDDSGNEGVTRLVGGFAASSDRRPFGEQLADTGADGVGVLARHGLGLRRLRGTRV